MIIEPEHLIKIEDVVSIADQLEYVQFSERSLQIIRDSHQRLMAIQNRGEPVYGINTGYGIFANKSISSKDIQRLNRKLILSHAVGIGEPLSERVVRAAMFIRVNTLSKGYSGVRPELIQTIIDMLNKGVTPVIPSKGSLGSSGDLCQLSHMALVISRDEIDDEKESGYACFDNQKFSGKQAMEKAGIERMILSTKEGLALNNGATFSTALAALAIYEAKYLLRISEVATALSMEALCARSGAMDARLHEARGQVGQIEIARELSDLVRGSTLIDSVDKVQDAYSIRCAPQVLGAVRDTIQYVESVINRELNAATDNPLIFEPADAISGGNFHGEPIGMVMDFLSIALCELGAISERRTFRITDEKTNHGLPPMLVGILYKPA
jgi:histidine ammonia-lyase